MLNTGFDLSKIWQVGDKDFLPLAKMIFEYQQRYCSVYAKYLSLIGFNNSNIEKLSDIPFLPIEFFKQHTIQTETFVPEIVFESSSTTGKGISKHAVYSANWYKMACTLSFTQHFGNPSDYCHLALLPGYLERKNSSLIYQVQHFIENSKYAQSGFFLYDFEKLHKAILYNEANKIPTILWGVTFALLQFADKYKLSLKNTTVIETGGMKGRGRELVREELHLILQEAFNCKVIGGEYGMTELMSQSYSKQNGRYYTSNTQKVIITELNDPFQDVRVGKTGRINVVDLANVHTCSFIATSDLGKQYSDGSFEVLGRIDHSDLRGCNLLV